MYTDICEEAMGTFDAITCDIDAETGRGKSQCCRGYDRMVVSYRNGCDASEGYTSYVEADAVCCQAGFINTACFEDEAFPPMAVGF